MSKPDFTKIAVQKQVEAMGCATFEVGMFNPQYQDKQTGEIGERMELRTWSRDTLLKDETIGHLKLKNMKGCIPDSEKRRFHRDGLDECIAALSTAIRPIAARPRLRFDRAAQKRVYMVVDVVVDCGYPPGPRAAPSSGRRGSALAGPPASPP